MRTRSFFRWVGIGLLFFPGAALAERWTPGGTNDPARFATSWHPVQYEFRLGNLPVRGSVENEHIPWSDSYWPLQRGGLANRWLSFREDSLDLARDGAVRESRYFGFRRYSISELLSLDARERARVLRELSPLEKYSLFLGDDSYGLVDRFSKAQDAHKSSWQGYCHAWAPVALHYPEPLPVVRSSREGLSLEFGSSDVKAVMIAAYADRVKASFGRFWNSLSRRTGNAVRRLRGAPAESMDATFIGARCARRFIYPDLRIRNGREEFAEYGDPSGIADADYGERLRAFRKKAIELGYRPEGGPSPSDPDFVRKALEARDDPACSDVNAGAFHVVLANQLGIRKEGFLIDKTRDVEVWNQPVFRFESVIETLAPGQRRVHVRTRIAYADDTDHGWAWWFPTLPALFGPVPGFEEEYRRYQSFQVGNGEAEDPPRYPDGILGSTEYEYELELDPEGRIIGGRWISFERPDFLWLFRKFDFSGPFSRLNEIYDPVRLPEEERPIIFSERGGR